MGEYCCSEFFREVNERPKTNGQGWLATVKKRFLGVWKKKTTSTTAVCASACARKCKKKDWNRNEKQLWPAGQIEVKCRMYVVPQCSAVSSTSWESIRNGVSPEKTTSTDFPSWSSACVIDGVCLIMFYKGATPRQFFFFLNNQWNWGFRSPFTGVDGAASEAGSALAELSLRRR